MTVLAHDEQVLRSIGQDACRVVVLEGSIRSDVQWLRSRGVSWRKIAAQLGVTRQAAQQRYGKDVLL